jgi:phosphohistidine phosphatase SixA
LALLLAAIAAAQGTPDRQHALEGKALVAALQRGGHVIYFRHADTGPAYMEQGIDLARCDTQRNLNDNGREEAKLIGIAFRRMAIPLGQVRTSEFCRCRETAQLAFGRFEVEPLLTGISRSPEAASRREQSAKALRKLLGAQPSAGKNDVLVSHGFNLWDAEGFHLGTQGEAAIYRPDGKGGYVLIARIAPRAWAELSGD